MNSDADAVILVSIFVVAVLFAAAAVWILLISEV